jgi:uncharacterized protein (TIGR00255 family)
MIRSMTGFGRAEGSSEAWTVAVEARSVNHRHLDIALRLPGALASLELVARRLVQARLDRGRVDVTVQLAPAGGRPARDVRVDEALAARYLALARTVGQHLGISGVPPMTWILERPGVLQVEEATVPEPQAVWSLLSPTLARALDEMVGRRTTEGAALATALRALRTELIGAVATMEERAPVAAIRRGERLRERMRTLLGEVPIDEARVATEVAVWAQKTDVAEELARLRAHLDELGLMLDKGGPVGRPLDFLVQELNREANTLSAKADDLEMSQAALAAKGILEKMREQVQNLE